MGVKIPQIIKANKSVKNEDPYIFQLRGNRKGQHSIKINDQWRIGFVWDENDAYEVEIADYH